MNTVLYVSSCVSNPSKGRVRLLQLTLNCDQETEGRLETSGHTFQMSGLN